MGKTSVNTKRLEQGAAALGRHMVAHPVGWLPVTTAAASAVVPACMNVAGHFYGVVGAGAAAAIAAGGWLIAEERIDWSQIRRRWPASWMVGNTATTSVALYAPITDLLPWGAGDIIAASMTIAAGLGIAWWHGLAARDAAPGDTARDGLRWALEELEISSQTTISPSQVNDKGDIEWTVTLGHDDQGKLDRSRLAWKLDVEPSRVLIRKAKGSSPRKYRVVLFKKGLGSIKSAPHPATIKANVAPGGDWAPGTRTVDMGAPLGPVAGSDDVAVISIYEPGYGAKHNLVSGMTGSGKSTLVASIIAHVAASVDAVNLGVDLGKAGEGFHDWYEAGAMAYLLCSPEDESQLLAAARQWLADVQKLNAEARRRGHLMKTGRVRDANGDKVRVWPASPENPVLVYEIEEYATAIANIRALDGRLADQIEEEINSLGRAARYAGISITLITQRPTEDELPTSIRGQLNQTIAGKLKTSSDAGRLANRDVDLVGDLRAGKGLCYVDADDYERPLLTKGYDLSKPKTCTQIARLYTDTQPAFNWEETTGTMTDDHTDTTEAAGADDDDDLFDLGADAEGAELAGVSITAPAAGDDEAADEGAADPQVILAALREAPEGLRRADVEGLYGEAVSAATALRALRRLQTDGLVVKTGRGKATRYKAAGAAADGAADAA